MIKPTIGRVVYYFPASFDLSGLQSLNNMVRHSDQPFDAHIVHVWSDICVNLVVFDHDGNMHRRTSVPINLPSVATPRAEWMPYQVGQAAKHAEAKAPA